MPDQLARLQEALGGRYALQRELGRGGTATVYLAEDLKHHRRVALKVLKPELAGPSFVSVHALRLDPRWDPIRNDPRFQALLVKYANPEPVR